MIAFVEQNAPGAPTGLVATFPLFQVRSAMIIWIWNVGRRGELFRGKFPNCAIDVVLVVSDEAGQRDDQKPS